MNKPQRFKPWVVLPEEISGPDPLSLGAVTLAMPFDTPEAARSQSELARALREARVNSVKDVCDAFEVKIRGNYIDASGNTVQAVLPVKGVDDFSIDGLTRLDHRLQALHVRARIYDDCSRYLSGKKKETLDGDEVAHLETLARILEDSEKENDHE